MSVRAVSPARDGLAAAIRQLHGLLLELTGTENPRLCPAYDEWDGLPRLLEVLDALAECQSRHEQARRAMHEAIGDVERVDAERQTRLLDLQHLLAAVANEPLLPTSGPDKLHCALSALRRSLNDGYLDCKGGGYLLCRNGAYELNPSIVIRIDIDEFLARYCGGRQAGGSAAIVHYEAACALYKGTFLPEDLYADWSLLHREQLEKTYLLMCEALAAHYLAAARPDEVAEWASRIIEVRPYDEAAFRQLMRASVVAGRRDEVVRQYRRCELLLREEFGV